MLKFELKRLASGSLVYGVGGILQRFMGLLMLPFFTRELTTEEYGIVALIALISVAFNGILNLGTGNSLGVLYFKEEDIQKRIAIVWSNAVLLFLNCLIVITLLVFIAPWISLLVFETTEHAGLLQLTFIGLAFLTFTEPFLAYLRMEERAKSYVVITLISAVLSIILSAWFVLGLKLGVLGMVLSSLITPIVIFLLVLVRVARHLPFQIDKHVFIPLVRVGFPSIFGLFAFLLIDYADRQMLQRLAGLDALGVYSVGYSFGMVMMIFIGAFGNAWAPFFMSFVNRREDARYIFGKVFKYYILGFGFLTLLFFALAKPVVSMMVGPNFQEAFLVVGLVAGAYMLKGCYLIQLPGLYFEHKLHIQSAIEWVAALINIVLNFILIPIYGIVGAAFATFISYLVLVFLSWFFAHKYLNIIYDQWRNLFIALILAAGMMVLFWLSGLDLTMGSNIALATTVIFSCLILLSVGLTREELMQIRSRLLFNKAQS